MLKEIIRLICPPLLWTGAALVRYKFFDGKHESDNKLNTQDLDLYWDPKFAEMLETWGEGNVWNEIQFLMCSRQGRVLDIACGTGRTIEILSQFPALELHGCDISDLLIQKAAYRGIPKDHLRVCDATKPDYEDNFFDYSYSIGSLEHFTEEGIEKTISECNRITRFSSFHQVPVSSSGKDEGWMKTIQSFYNNSVDWWLSKFKLTYETVYVLDSVWRDEISVGKWFVCVKE